MRANFAHKPKSTTNLIIISCLVETARILLLRNRLNVATWLQIIWTYKRYVPTRPQPLCSLCHSICRRACISLLRRLPGATLLSPPLRTRAHTHAHTSNNRFPYCCVDAAAAAAVDRCLNRIVSRKRVTPRQPRGCHYTRSAGLK